MRDVFNYEFCKKNNANEADCIDCMRFYRRRDKITTTKEYLSFVKYSYDYFVLLHDKRIARSRYTSNKIIEAKQVMDHWREKLKERKKCEK